MEHISFEVTDLEAALVNDILDRLEAESTNSFDRESLGMDLTACHANGNPMDFDGLLHASGFDFLHDVWGIQRHMDRSTGKLLNFFLPRYSRPESANAA